VIGVFRGADLRDRAAPNDASCSQVLSLLRWSWMPDTWRPGSRFVTEPTSRPTFLAPL